MEYYYSAIKRHYILIHTTTWLNLENTEQKQPDTKGLILYNAIYMKCPEQVNPN